MLLACTLRRTLKLCLLCITLSTFAHAQNVPAPGDTLGFTPGDNRKLANWQQTIDYFKRLDAASDRLIFEELGRTTMDKAFVMATISSPENLRQLNKYKEIQRKLADPRLLGNKQAQRDKAARELIKQGKTVVLITCGIHSTEVGSHLSSMLIAHRLASSNDEETRKILDSTIILLVPSLNPDGVDIVKDWYDKTLNTPYEGTSPPVLYHVYTGHDNNRDWYAFTQKETQITVDKIHNVWHPQIVHDIHQQGTNGARLFLPPYLPPVEPNVPREIIEGYTELGTAMFKDLRAQNFKGITINSSYDAWTPARAYSHYHGGVRILSETASARLASPITVKFEDLRDDDNAGFNPRVSSPNFPDVWQGGEWTLRDITNYMTAAAFSLLKHASENREAWLTRFYKIGSDSIKERKKGELFAFVLPPTKTEEQHRNRFALIGTLLSAGVSIELMNPSDVRGNKASNIADLFRVLTERGNEFRNLAIVVRMNQPYGAFAKAILEKQDYPNLRDTSGNPIPPYDVTAHTLSLLTGVEAVPVYEPFDFRPAILKLKGNKLEFEKVILQAKRFALYKSYVPSMDEGWTRWIFDNEYYINLAPKSSTLEDKEARAGNLRAKYDAIIIPDQTSRAIFEGHKQGTMPDEYTGGLGAEGVQSLREFVEAGGTLITLNRASRFAIENFNLPLRDVTENLKRTEFYCPGSILRTELDTAHPLTNGMTKDSIAWFENSPVFEVAPDAANVRVIARYPNDKSALLSGYLLGEQTLHGKAALVEVRLGKGRIILFGFRPQYRGQSLATYPLLFNALK